jgi:uncharacterized membrane protein YcaP (DUF421 family)
MFFGFFETDLLKTFNDIFILSLPIIEKIIRPILVYIFLVIALRIFGKRELAQLNPFDLIVLLLLSNTVQNSIIGDDDSFSGGAIGAFTLLSFNYIVVRFLFKHRRLDQIIEGKETMLIENGIINRAAMAKELLTESELNAVAHRQGFKSIKSLKTFRLEANGNISLEGKEPSFEEKRHQELLEKLDDLTKQVAAMQQKLV